MRLLSKEQIMLLHCKLIERYGGSAGIRDEELLDSAINAPMQEFGGTEFYPTVADKAVRLAYGLVNNHPFVDGNKRIGALAMLTMLDMNSIFLRTDSAELTEVFLRVASGEVSEPELLTWVIERIEE